MGLRAITWFEVEKNTRLLNSLLLLFDEVYVPNFLWLESGGNFENVFLKLSSTMEEIYDVVITPAFLGVTPEQNAIPFCEVFGPLPMKRKQMEGVFVPFFDVLHALNEYPPNFKDVVECIFEKINGLSPFKEYNRFTYDYASIAQNGLYFIGKREARGENWYDNFRSFIEKCLDVENNMPIVIDARTIFDIEKYRSHSSTNLRYNPDILISGLLLTLAKIHIKDFVTNDPHIILELRESVQGERTALVNKMREHSMILHKLLDNEASFADLLKESEFVVKTEILPAFENAKTHYEREMNKSFRKKFISFTDKMINFGLSAFTLNYSEAKDSLKDMYDICTGQVLREKLLKSGQGYSNYCYLLRIEQEAT